MKRIVWLLIAIAAADGLFEAFFGARLSDLVGQLELTSFQASLFVVAFNAGLLLGSGANLLFSRSKRAMLGGAFIGFIPALAFATVLASGQPPTLAYIELIGTWAIAGVGVGLLGGAHARATTTAFADHRGSQLVLGWKLGVTAVGAAIGVYTKTLPLSVSFAGIGAVCLVLSVPAAILVAAAPAPARPPADSHARREQEIVTRGRPSGGLLDFVRIALILAAAGSASALVLNFGVASLQGTAPPVLIGIGTIAFTLAQAAAMLLAGSVKLRTLILVRSAFALDVAGMIVLACGVNFRSWLAMALGYALVGFGVAPLIGIAQRAAFHTVVRGISPARRQAAAVTAQFTLTIVSALLLGTAAGKVGVSAAVVIVMLGVSTAMAWGLPLLTGNQ